MKKIKSDVCVVGAGMVGLASALLLSQQGFKVCVIDSKPVEPDLSEKGLLRVSAINESSKRLLQDLKVWEGIAEEKRAPYTKMCVWDGMGQGEITFSASEHGFRQLGFIVANEAIRSALLEQIHKQPLIEIYSSLSLESIEQQEEQVQLLTSCGYLFKSSLVVAADGANSWVRQALNFPMDEKAYGHHAIVATVSTEKPMSATAYQRFLPSGPLAFLPLNNEHRASIVWSTPPELAEQRMAMPNEIFEDELTRAAEGRLGRVQLDSERLVFPLVRRHVKRYIAQRVVLVGDAKHTVHPMAGQGVNLGFGDVLVLADTMANAVNKKIDYAGDFALRQYERNRKLDTVAMLTLLDALKWGFSTDAMFPTLARNLGMSVVEKLPVLKRELIHQAMGISRNRPQYVN